jgi:flavodoxin I
MANVKVIFGSTTGATESAAAEIAAAFGVTAVNVANASAEDFKADLLILGSSTWGLGELQDDWAAKIGLLEQADLKGKIVAVFGLGDQSGFADTYCDAMGILAQKAKSRGALLIGQTSTEGYSHSSSVAAEDGLFCGLALDDNNEQEKTSSRIGAWVETLKQRLG